MNLALVGLLFVGLALFNLEAAAAIKAGGTVDVGRAALARLRRHLPTRRTAL